MNPEHLRRREFLAGAGIGALFSSEHRLRAQIGSTSEVVVSVDVAHPGPPVPADFSGLGYEISSVARTGLLSAGNYVYVQLVRNLGRRGVIRIGGNTADFASYSPDGTARSAPKGTIINRTNLQELAGFLRATQWKLIWALNLGQGSEQDVATEAQAVAGSIGDSLLAFEIGNEPDLFGRGTGHRAMSYAYADYLAEYRRYKAAIRRVLPAAPFAAPDAASAVEWVVRFASDEGSDLRLLTQHYYRECAGPASTLDKLLRPDPKLGPMLAQLRSASALAHVPTRICETNSFCGGGKPGVSDTFGAALWVLDFMFKLASAGVGGVNLETGVNQLGFISSYSPIADDESGHYSAAAEYYGMLAFAHASGGRTLPTSYEAGARDLSVFAVLTDDARLLVTVINKSGSDQTIRIESPSSLARAYAQRLTGPSLDAKSGVRFASAAVATSGIWTGLAPEPLRVQQKTCLVAVKAASAAVITLES